MGLSNMFDALKKESLVVGALDLYLMNKPQADNDRAVNVNAPSQVGGCPREAYYSRLKFPHVMTIEPRAQRIFDNGSYFHLRMQQYLREMGMLLIDEVPCYNDTYNIQGHSDGLLKIGDDLVVLELKSIKHEYFTELKDAHTEHKEQSHVYMYCLEQRRQFIRSYYKTIDDIENNIGALYAYYASHFQHLKGGRKHTREEKIEFQCDLCYNTDIILLNTEKPINITAVVYEDKNDQSLKEYDLSYNSEVVQKILDSYTDLNTRVAYQNIPERLGTSKSGQPCRFCKFRNECWVV